MVCHLPCTPAMVHCCCAIFVHTTIVLTVASLQLQHYHPTTYHYTFPVLSTPTPFPFSTPAFPTHLPAYTTTPSQAILPPSSTFLLCLSLPHHLLKGFGSVQLPTAALLWLSSLSSLFLTPLPFFCSLSLFISASSLPCCLMHGWWWWWWSVKEKWRWAGMNGRQGRRREAGGRRQELTKEIQGSFPFATLPLPLPFTIHISSNLCSL